METNEILAVVASALSDAREIAERTGARYAAGRRDALAWFEALLEAELAEERRGELAMLRNGELLEHESAPQGRPIVWPAEGERDPRELGAIAAGRHPEFLEPLPRPELELTADERETVERVRTLIATPAEVSDGTWRLSRDAIVGFAPELVVIIDRLAGLER